MVLSFGRGGKDVVEREEALMIVQKDQEYLIEVVLKKIQHLNVNGYNNIMCNSDDEYNNNNNNDIIENDIEEFEKLEDSIKNLEIISNCTDWFGDGDILDTKLFKNNSGEMLRKI